MFFRFPPAAVPAHDSSFITGKAEVFAKLKIESKAGKRTVFLTEHTVILVNRGVKLLHFPGHTLEVGAQQAVLLKRGIYVMAEYIEEGLDFEALLLFMPARHLRSLALPAGRPRPPAEAPPYLVLPADALVQDFKAQLRRYFDQPRPAPDHLLPLKQQELLLLLSAAAHAQQLADFVAEALRTEPAALDFIVRTHLLQPVTVADLAQLSNRSLASFKRDFQRHYHCPPRQWLNQQRLAHARLLLQDGHKRVAEVAQECGFENTSYFIRIFKKQYGHTPQALRAKTAMD
ncbi:helix-turn-helix transcriptional regulator [Hymenobacter negativus]|uniref:Helix-turn-helix transcriptional regulator n=1 Tax=Hymenobacter negativus TaxID=2795026 RepID=A0ABS3QFI0_9BACT|nr:AraC family transcriptional regulator [Hymenobacter negativus]MBO2009445.1 helix-turn-helix transcriptional regulator [Hymenobacter negativus]